MLFHRLSFQLRILFFRRPEAGLDQVNVALGCRNAFRRFLLERMQDIDRFGQSHSIDSTIRVAIVVVYNF